MLVCCGAARNDERHRFSFPSIYLNAVQLVNDAWALSDENNLYLKSLCDIDTRRRLVKLVISDEVKQVMGECIGWRRHLHENPELSFEEYDTTNYLENKLSELEGIVLRRYAKTGVVAILRGAKPGRTILLRADIDALPIQEDTGLPFASKKPGVMHACGHDGHTAMMLAAATILSKERDCLSGEVRFLFQHAEEQPPGGAAELARLGVMDGVDELYGLHLSSLYPTGRFGVRAGALTSATDRFEIDVVGKGGHSAYPEGAHDAIVMAAQVVLAIQTIVSRRVAATEPIVVSVCQINAGTAYNILPDEVHIVGSTRTFSEKTRKRLPKIMEDIVRGITETDDSTYRFRFVKGYASVVNDAALTSHCRNLIEKNFGHDATFDIEPLMPGEDYSALQGFCPGFFVELGARNEEKGIVYPHHNPHYLLDEDALQYGVEYWCDLVRDRLS